MFRSLFVYELGANGATFDIVGAANVLAVVSAVTGEVRE